MRMVPRRLAPTSAPQPILQTASVSVPLSASLSLSRRLGVLLAALASLAACGPEIQYRVRPGYATSSDLPDEIVLEDGSIIRYVSLPEYIARKKAREEGRRYKEPARTTAVIGGGFQPWLEADDGSVRMLANEPEHVVFITMRAFREERYGELWDQMVAANVRSRAESELGVDGARKKFIAWCAASRQDAMILLNRMSFAFATNGVVFRRLGGNMTRLSLTPQISGDFKLKLVEIAYEPAPEPDNPAKQTLKLAGIR
jgi:hypothetical protein